MSLTHPVQPEDLWEIILTDIIDDRWDLGTDGNFYVRPGIPNDYDDQYIQWFDINGNISSKKITQPNGASAVRDRLRCDQEEPEEYYYFLNRPPQLYRFGTDWTVVYRLCRYWSMTAEYDISQYYLGEYGNLLQNHYQQVSGTAGSDNRHVLDAGSGQFVFWNSTSGNIDIVGLSGDIESYDDFVYSYVYGDKYLMGTWDGHPDCLLKYVDLATGNEVALTGPVVDGEPLTEVGTRITYSDDTDLFCTIEHNDSVSFWHYDWVNEVWTKLDWDSGHVSKRYKIGDYLYGADAGIYVGDLDNVFSFNYFSFGYGESVEDTYHWTGANASESSANVKPQFRQIRPEWAMQQTNVEGIYANLGNDLVRFNEFPFGLVKGTVENEEGVPKEGATIVAEPTEIATEDLTTGEDLETTSDENGEFELILPANLEYEITISYIRDCHVPGGEEAGAEITAIITVPEGVKDLGSFEVTENPPSTDIYTAEDLFNLRYCPDREYQLMNDIDLTDFQVPDYHENILTENNITGWLPINDYWQEAYAWSGVLNGNGYKIKNLEISSDVNYVGLFAAFSSGTVQNVILENVNVAGNNNTGSLIGQAITGVVDYCFASGVVESSGSRVGGLVGYITGGLSVEKCGANVEVTLTGGHDAGGLTGWVASSSAVVKNCYSVGDVSGYNYVGGLVADNSGLVENCYSVGDVVSDGSFVGPIAANEGQGVVNSYYNDETIIDDTDFNNFGMPTTTVQMRQTESKKYDQGNKPGAGETWQDYWQETESGTGDWIEGDYYEIGNTVEVEGQRYECIENHFAYEDGVYYLWNFGDPPGNLPANYNDFYPELLGTINGIWWVPLVDISYKIHGQSHIFLRSPYNVFVKTNGVWLPADVFAKDDGFKPSAVYVKTEGQWQLIQE